MKHGAGGRLYKPEGKAIHSEYSDLVPENQARDRLRKTIMAHREGRRGRGQGVRQEQLRARSAKATTA